LAFSSRTVLAFLAGFFLPNKEKLSRREQTQERAYFTRARRSSPSCGC
jgi:hypothetical protein